MKPTEVRVECGRTITDGNYGSERVSVGMTAPVDDLERVTEVIRDLLDWCRAEVLHQLRTSGSAGVKASLRHEGDVEAEEEAGS